MYDLGDAIRWEFFFPNVDKPLLVVPGDEPKLDEIEDEENLEVWNLTKNVTFDCDDLYQISSKIHQISKNVQKGIENAIMM